MYAVVIEMTEAPPGPGVIRELAMHLAHGEAGRVELIARGSRIWLYLAWEAPPQDRQPEGIWMFAAVAEHGAYWFRVDAYVAPSYVSERLGLAYGDGETVAELLARLGLASANIVRLNPTGSQEVR